MSLSAYTKTCAKNVGGNSALELMTVADLTAVTVVAGEITAITAPTGKGFATYQADRDTIIRTEEGTGTPSNISYTHTVEAKFQKNGLTISTMRDALAAASPCGILAIVEDGNGTKFLVGWSEAEEATRALYLAQDSFTSGAAPSDADSNLVTIQLTTISGYTALPLSSSATYPTI